MPSFKDNPNLQFDNMKTRIGIYNHWMAARGGGEKKSLTLAEHLSRTHEVWLLADEPFDVPQLERYFDVDLSRVKVTALGGGPDIVKPSHGRLATLKKTVLQFQNIKSLNLDVFINNSFGSTLPCPAPRGVYMFMFPHDRQGRAHDFPHRAYFSIKDWIEKCLMGQSVSEFLTSYSSVTANSKFTAEWVRRIWDREAEVIYSACSDMGPPLEKEKIILNVGRFEIACADTPLKRQDVLLEAFKKLRSLHQDGWHLHFVGSLARHSGLSPILERLKFCAAGFPVSFHFDMDLDALRDLYRRAAIYWHATGYGSTAPVLQEHFGMTTTEAMSAGAVPVVINSGGQKEIVTDGLDGFLWDDPVTLTSRTAQLINEPDSWRRLSRQAVLSNARFSKAAFNHSMDVIVDRLLEGSPVKAGLINAIYASLSPSVASSFTEPHNARRAV